MRNKSEASKSKCPICREYLKTHTHYSDICIINNENMETCDNNQWQAGKMEKSKLDEARGYNFTTYHTAYFKDRDFEFLSQEIQDDAVVTKKSFDKKIELYESAIKELEDKIYELQGEVTDEANEVAKLKEKLKQQLKIDDDKIISLIMCIYDLYRTYFIAPPYIQEDGELGLKSGDLKILRDKLLDYFGVRHENW